MDRAVLNSAAAELATRTGVLHAGRTRPLTDIGSKPMITPESDVQSIASQDSKDTSDLRSPAADARILRNDLGTPRRRGRPRKHPLAEPRKVTHARSRTGCATCRRRKKKCDERRPTCLACEKNNVFCDGYEPLVSWKSGKDRSVMSPIDPPTTIPELPLLVNGVEDELDQSLLGHFLNSLCGTLSLHGARTSLQDIVVPLAMSNQGLMHGILFLSSTHLLARESSEDRHAWLTRQAHHSSMSMRLLQEDLACAKNSDEPQAGDAVLLHALILCLQTIAAGDTTGAWRIHSRGVLQILLNKQWFYRDSRAQQYVEETFLHHECCAAMTNLATSLEQPSIDILQKHGVRSPFTPPPDTEGSSMIGIRDGLFKFVPRIQALRSHVKERRETQSLWVDDQTLVRSMGIDNEMRNWKCPYAVGTTRYTACLLYRQAVWLYLHRTLQPHSSSTIFQKPVDEGLKYLAILHDSGETSVQSVMLMPLFMLGCAAFEQKQRPHITEALERLQSWGYMGNVQHVRTILEQVWGYMDAGNGAAAWDWEQLVSNRNWDMIVT